MAIRLLNKLSPFWYTPISQRDDPKPTRYHLNPMSQPEVMEMRFLLEEGKVREAMHIAISGGLIGWENQMDEDDSLVEFSLSSAFQLPFEVLDEIASTLERLSKLTETERKNLLLQWTSEPTEPESSTAGPAPENTAQQSQTTPSGQDQSDPAATTT